MRSGIVFTAALALVACGRVRFDPIGDDAIDAPIPDAFSGCMPPVVGTFGAPSLITALNTASLDGTPSLSDDSLEIYFKSERPGSMGIDIWRSTRPTASTGWSAPVPASDLNSTANETSPELSSDGLTIWFSSSRAGGLGGDDIWVATRTTTDGMWSPPAPVPELSSVASDEGVSVQPSMLVAYLHSDRGGSNQIYRSERATVTEPWGTPMLVDLTPGYDSQNPWLSADECAIYFMSTLPGDLGMYDLYVATRATPTSAWDTPVPLTSLNHAEFDADPWLSADQRAIYFTSNRPNGGNAFDLFESSR